MDLGSCSSSVRSGFTPREPSGEGPSGGEVGAELLSSRAREARGWVRYSAVIQFTFLWLLWIVVLALSPNLIPSGSVGEPLRLILEALQPIKWWLTAVFTAVLGIAWLFVLLRRHGPRRYE